MRLICPNCGAQYEVDEDLVPPTGRDVQCSNCGQAWFQKHASMEDEAEEQAGEDLAATRPLEEDAVTRPVGWDRDNVQPEADQEAAQAAPPDDGSEDESLEPPAHERAQLDDSVRNILVEEAERETSARRDEGGLETQSDLGLVEDSGQKGGGIKDRMARLRGLDVDDRADGTAAAIAAATAAGSRRELLPDIEEINSSLRAAEEREDLLIEQEAEEAETGRSGFRTGFLLIVLLAIAAAAVYLFAPTITEMVPQAEPAMTGYVEWVDRMRIVVDDTARVWVEKITAMIREMTGDAPVTDAPATTAPATDAPATTAPAPTE